MSLLEHIVKSMAFGLAISISSFSLMNQACFADQKEAELIQRIEALEKQDQEGPFRFEQDSLPQGLFLYLADNGVRIRFVNGRFVSYKITDTASQEYLGLHNEKEKRITLTARWEKGTAVHEGGHEVWGLNGGGNIFSEKHKKNYAGPTQEVLLRLMKRTNEYQEQTMMVLERFSHESFCRLIELRFVNKEEVQRKYKECSEAKTKAGYNAFLHYANEKGAKTSRNLIENMINTETFATLAEKYAAGISTLLDGVFPLMYYKRVKLFDY